MTAAILFRGHAHRLVGTERPWGVDWRKCIESQRKYLIEPMSARFGLVHTHLSSYEVTDDLWQLIRSDYKPSLSQWDATRGTQKRCMMTGLNGVSEFVANGHNYDFIAVCRFDLELLSNPMDHAGFDPTKVNFLWREWNELNWNDHRRVPDAIHFLPGRFLEGFIKGVEETPSDNCLHLVYRPVSKYVREDNINIIIKEGYIDSNTDHCQNPFYKMIRVTQ